MSRPDGVLSLPGPERLLESIAGDIEAGRSAVVVFPQVAIDSGFADGLLANLGERVGAEACLPPLRNDRRNLPERLADLARAGPFNPGFDPWRDLVNWVGSSGLRVLLRSWNEPLDDVVRRWAALLHEAGHEPSERPALILGIDSQTADRTRVEFEDALFLRDHWWWGTINRLDTAVHVHRTGMTVSTLHLAAVEEVAAWDLELAAALSHRWDGTRSKLPDVLSALRSPPIELAEHAASAAGASDSLRPPRSARSDWDAGLVEAWDGRLRWRTDAPTRTETLDKLLWRAQSRVVMSHLDEQRTRLADEFVRRARADVLRAFEIERGENAIWELGDMHHRVVTGQVKLAAPISNYLATARKVRNAIAHGRPARDGDLRRLMAGYPDV